MKFFAFVFSASLLSSCIYQQKEMERPVSVSVQPVANAQIRVQKNKATQLEIPATSPFIGQYARWLRTEEPFGYGFGVISIDAIHEKSQRIAFTTLFLANATNITPRIKSILRPARKCRRSLR